MVSRISPTATGKLKKYEPLEAREFADFTNFSSLTLKNVKQACKDHYHQQIGSCDVLHSDRGPSCVKDSQIAGKKVFVVRFLEPMNYTRMEISNQRTVPSKKIKLTTTQSLLRILKNTPPSSTTYPKSLSVADLLRAGRIVRPKEEIEALLVLEFFDIYKKQWFKMDPQRFHIETEKFAIGGFRNAFKAYTTNPRECWVIKRFQMKEWEKSEPYTTWIYKPKHVNKYKCT